MFILDFLRCFCYMILVALLLLFIAVKFLHLFMQRFFQFLQVVCSDCFNRFMVSLDNLKRLLVHRAEKELAITKFANRPPFSFPVFVWLAQRVRSIFLTTIFAALKWTESAVDWWLNQLFLSCFVSTDSTVRKRFLSFNTLSEKIYLFMRIKIELLLTNHKLVCDKLYYFTVVYIFTTLVQRQFYERCTVLNY